MSITNDPRLDLIPEGTQLLDDEIRTQVWGLLSVLSADRFIERPARTTAIPSRISST